MESFSLYFDNTQLLILLIAGVCFAISLFFQSKGKASFAVAFLVLTGIFVFSFAALMDPFLNLWDERFHALVGKNLMNHPLMPTLYDDPVVSMAYDRWDRYYIWLHKQPLFLWQIALSFKLFGISEFTLRLPNIVLGAALVYAGYRSGMLLVGQRAGYISGILIIINLYIFELITGRQELEHNDFTFFVYVSLSLWSFIEYHFSQNKIWIYLIGMFSGMAILCKWLVGLLVYLGWFVLRILQEKYTFSANKDLFISLVVTVLIALPWQVLSFMWYPAEAGAAFQFNALHFTKALEGHGGSFWYHFDMFKTIYGSFALLLIIPALYFMYKSSRDKKLYYSLLSMVLVVYLFFSLAATKMPSFTIVVAMIVFMAFASLLDTLLNFACRFLKKGNLRALLFVLAIVALVVVQFEIGYLQEKHSIKNEANSYSRQLLHNKEIFKSLDLAENTVLFNVKGRHYIEAMFYTGLPAYNFIPTLEQYEDLKTKGRLTAIFAGQDTELPGYLKDNPSVLLINKDLQGYE
ncbi:MAG: glycosyltransferase family 39 protein [Bacteroidales bacterium]|nr:glycosyltransferase family 39 protein [Bacteroidales bacterium]MCF8457949.1 glycosyltransferase family 39 protein [Bacteroidales bacterium]